jgi:signal recognition particle subunit SEC65
MLLRIVIHEAARALMESDPSFRAGRVVKCQFLYPACSHVQLRNTSRVLGFREVNQDARNPQNRWRRHGRRGRCAGVIRALSGALPPERTSIPAASRKIALSGAENRPAARESIRHRKPNEIGAKSLQTHGRIPHYSTQKCTPRAARTILWRIVARLHGGNRAEFQRNQ